MSVVDINKKLQPGIDDSGVDPDYGYHSDSKVTHMSILGRNIADSSFHTTSLQFSKGEEVISYKGQVQIYRVAFDQVKHGELVMAILSLKIMRNLLSQKYIK